MEGEQVRVILSDCDGTLCPTISVTGDVGMILNGLDFESPHNVVRFILRNK